MSTTIQAKVQKQLSWAMVNSHQNGLISRAARTILSCASVNEIMRVVTRALDELGLSGGGRISGEGIEQSFQFGAGLNMPHCSGLSCLSALDERVYLDQNALVFSEDNFLLIVSFKPVDDHSRELLQENLTVFVDIVQSCLLREQEFVHSKLLRQKERIAEAVKISEVASCLGRLTQHLVHCHNSTIDGLISELSLTIPRQGLSREQNACITEITNKVSDKQRRLLEAQSRQNEDLKQIMTKVSKGMLKSESKAEKLQTEVPCPQLF